jgi:hypothetical protein
MNKIINKKLSEEEFIMLINLAISFYKKKRDTISNEKKAIMPYCKWHYKFIINLNKNKKEKRKKK